MSPKVGATARVSTDRAKWRKVLTEDVALAPSLSSRLRVRFMKYPGQVY